MKSKASYFSLSPAIIKENFRRFWALPALAFLVYFLSGIFPLLMSYNDLNPMASMIQSILNNQYFFYMGLSLIVPVAAACVCFKYMNQPASATYMNSLPLSRARLFNSNLLSGLLMSLAPMLLTGLVLLLISKPTYYTFWLDGELVTDDAAVNLFARADILAWMAQGIVMILFVYAVAVFAGLVCGNVVVHVLASFFFLFVAPLMYLVLSMYFDHYIFGYCGFDDDLLSELSAWIYALRGDGYTDILLVIYIAVSILLIVISALLYQKRKMERAGDAVTVSFMIPVVNYTIAFLGMTLMGFFFDGLKGGYFGAYFYAGLVAGTLIFFTIGRMIVLKTPRIFNKKTLKSLGIYCLIVVVFFAVMLLDLTHYGNYVPDSPKQAYTSALTAGYVGRYDTGSGSIFSDEGFTFKDAENVALVTAFQQSIIDNAGSLKNQSAYDAANPDNTGWRNVRFSYSENATDYIREYYLPLKFLEGSEELAQLFDSEEFRSHFSFENIDRASIVEIVLQETSKVSDGGEASEASGDAALSGDGNESSALQEPSDCDFEDTVYYSSDVSLGKDEYESFLAAREADFAETTYSEYLDESNIIGNYYIYSEEKPSSGRAADVLSYYLDDYILKSDTHTLEWISEHGYKLNVLAVRVSYDASDL